MTKTNTTMQSKAGGRGDEQTAAQIRSILASAEIKERDRLRLAKLIQSLHEESGNCALEDSPELLSLAFKVGADGFHYRDKKGRASADERDTYGEIVRLADRCEPKDVRLSRLITARAFATRKEARAAAAGEIAPGSVAEAVSDLAGELSMFVIHPEILPHALPVILREARATVREKGYQWRHVRELLRRLEEAALERGE